LQRHCRISFCIPVDNNQARSWGVMEGREDGLETLTT
jgi:hypothetical protein